MRPEGHLRDIRTAPKVPFETTNAPKVPFGTPATSQRCPSGRGQGERDRSGYRTYDAAAVVRLIRIHTLADAGVPLARVQELLDAGPEEFADGVGEIDKELRAEIRRLQGTRKRLARLAAGEHLALPRSVVDYLDRLRGLGVEEWLIEPERDAWVMIAAQAPHLIDAVIAKKQEDLDDPDMLKLYSLLNGSLDWPADDPRVIEVVDILERLAIRAVEAGEVGADGFDDRFVDLLDATMVESSPGAERLVAILAERGWRGWTRIERVPADRLHTDRLHTQPGSTEKFSSAEQPSPNTATELH